MEYIHYAETDSGVWHCFDTLEECSAWANKQAFGVVVACYVIPIDHEHLMPSWDERTRVIRHINED